MCPGRGASSGKSGLKNQVALHYYTILRLRIGARLTRYRNCKFHNFARTISRHADSISRYSVPPSAGPLLPLGTRAGFKGGANWAVAQGPPQKNSKP